MRRRWSQWVLAVAGLGLSLAAEPVVRIGGSELVGPAVAEALRARAADRGERVQLEFHGSRPAWDKLSAGALDVGILIADPGAAELSDDWVALPLAFVAARVVVRAELSIEQVSFAQLYEVFAAQSSVSTLRWGEFGAAGSAANVPVLPHVVTAEGGLAHEIFVHRVLGGEALKASTGQWADSMSALAAVRAEEGAVAIVPWLGEGETDLKALLVASHGEEVAFGPSDRNLVSGDYPLGVALNLVARRDRVAELWEWLRFCYSEEMTEAWREGEISPLPRSDRNHQIFAWEAWVGSN